LGEEIVESDGKGEVETMNVQGGSHRTPLTKKRQRPVANVTWKRQRSERPKIVSQIFASAEMRNWDGFGRYRRSLPERKCRPSRRG
jgi:hypothetical protein